jgi:hypothetical protein
MKNKIKESANCSSSSDYCFDPADAKFGGNPALHTPDDHVFVFNPKLPMRNVDVFSTTNGKEEKVVSISKKNMFQPLLDLGVKALQKNHPSVKAFANTVMMSPTLAESTINYDKLLLGEDSIDAYFNKSDEMQTILFRLGIRRIPDTPAFAAGKAILKRSAIRVQDALIQHGDLILDESFFDPSKSRFKESTGAQVKMSNKDLFHCEKDFDNLMDTIQSSLEDYKIPSLEDKFQKLRSAFADFVAAAEGLNP